MVVFPKPWKTSVEENSTEKQAMFSSEYFLPVLTKWTSETKKIIGTGHLIYFFAECVLAAS